VAVEFQGQSLTYRDLDRRAESLGHELLELGLGPDRLAAIYLPRSIELIVAMIAVWKAGGAMLPLDPSTPADRVAALISDSGATIALTTRALLGMIPESVHRICVEECTCRPSTNPLPPGVPEHLAYVIYTSGSTGQPKGVAVEHRALSEYIGGACGVYQIDSSDRVLQFASLGFDTMIEELFPTLACGATVVLRTPEMLESFDAFIEKCDEWKISVISPPTSYWARLVSAISGSGLSIPPCVRLTIIGGEAARPKSVELWKSVRGNSDLANTYGPTEATVVATAWILKHSDDRSFDVIPIGAPLAHSEIHLLNEGLQPVPLGAPGELYIGGRALARGYLHRPDLTAESFVSRPRTGQRLYRTGDLARYRPDGSLEFLGRVDHQVKIRGFRVEVGEVESMIETHPEVAECVVAAYRNSIDELQLTAFVVLRSDRGPTPAGLRQFLKDRAPAFLVPASIAIAPALPRLANGKIDHHALPALLAGLEPEEGEFVAPATETEKQVAAIWAEVLPVERIGAHDDFFSLGGHSLQMTQILSRVRSVFDVAVSLAAFFERPTVSGMAEAILSSAVSTRAPKRPQSFASDAILGPEFTRIDKPFRSVPKGPILLTGSTGFLGAFLLRELLLQTEQSIFCLVRTVDAESGLSRIRRALESYGIWDNRAAARIRPIPGDLGKPRLGLPPALFEGLANEVRSIYHCGATVNFFYPYSVLKSANVDGTREIHRLAVTGPVKPVFFVSTTSIAGNRSPDRLPNGYDQTKWVAEQMTRNAIELGIPAAIFRPAALSGDTRTGACNADDFIHRFLRGCIALGAAPTVDSAIDLLPVDLVSRDIVAESLNPACLGLTYNMINQRKSCLTHLTRQLDALGFPIRHEPYSHWRARLAGLEETHPLAPIAALFPEKETSAGSELDLSGVPTDEAISITYPSADHHLGILASYLRKQGLVGETRHKALVES
jgi:amino acid adenylation domain-containing protein/thioester reductase-like protein